MPPSPIYGLSIDLLHVILEQLDTYSLAALAQTCRLFYNLVRYELSFEPAVWQQQHDHPRQDYFTHLVHWDGMINTTDSSHAEPNHLLHPPPDTRVPTVQVIPPVFHPRSLCKIGNKLYMPFMTVDPVCFVYDIDSGQWDTMPHTLVSHIPESRFHPIVTPVAAVGTRIYMFGGRRVLSSTLSDTMYMIETTTWDLYEIEYAENMHVPRPRFEHTLDVWQDRYLIMFGGMCPDSPGENDLFFYDTVTNTWLEPSTRGQTPPIRYSHASALVENDLYIFGGCQSQPEGVMVHDILYRFDCASLTWYKYDHPEAYYYRRRRGASQSDDSYDNMSITNSENDANHSAVAAMANAATATAVATATPGGISTSLERDLILETTGHPPRDRFNCVLVVVGHKLLVLGGQTVRQDREDNNVLHVHSMRNIDVLNIRRKHWSAMTTGSLHDNSVYPQDVTGFLLDESKGGCHKIIILGQQKVFAAATDSSGGSSAMSDNLPPLASPPSSWHLQQPPPQRRRQPHPHQQNGVHRDQRGSDVSWDTAVSSSSSNASSTASSSFLRHTSPAMTAQQQQRPQSAAAIHSKSASSPMSRPNPQLHHVPSAPAAPVTAPPSSSMATLDENEPGPSNLQQRQRRRFHLSRPIIDYDGYLDTNVPSLDENMVGPSSPTSLRRQGLAGSYQSGGSSTSGESFGQQHPLSPMNIPESGSSLRTGSSGDDSLRPSEASNRHYTSEPLVLELWLNRHPHV